MSYHIQSVLLPRNDFSLENAKAWIKQNNFLTSYEGKSVHVTDKYFRFRQKDPSYFNEKTLRAKRLNRDIILIVGRLK